MKGGGIENPAFETPSSDFGQRYHAGPAGAGAVAAAPAGPEPCPEEGPCGWGPCTPRALQLCNNSEGYLAAYSLLAIFQGIVVNGLINISISTIEKRYELSSSLTGLISASYDIAFCLLSLFVSYVGERGHKPRWLAFSAFMLGLGSLVFSLPHFSSGKYQYGSKIEGVGHAMSLLGPAIGYVLGGQLLQVYIDIQIPKSTKVDQDDPRWLGAWWIGFLACFFAIWLLIIPFSCFPRHLPGTAKIQAEKIPETHDDGGQVLVQTNNYGQSFKDFPMSLLILLRNPVLMSLIVASSSEALVATGFATFLPKFIENQFGKSSSFSATLGGLVLIPGAALGQVISGFLVSKRKMDCRGIIKFMISTCSVALILNTVFLFAKCGNEPFAGVSETYNGTGTLYNLTAPCNANCRCLRSIYYPVCGSDEVQYFSPCFAGCASYLFNNMKKTYHNCSCIGKPKRGKGSEDFLYEAVPGKCPTRCNFLPLFLTFFFFAVVFTFMATTPTTVAILRCVPDKQRSFALGVQLLFLRLLGTIPGPILFGVAIDNSCTLWDINECETKGVCWVYDNERMAYLLMGISAACKIVTIIFVVMAVYFYKPPPITKALPQKASEKISVIHT
ncbi:solute carrier organic anion transporter family member 4C1 isoform X2 [Haemorhous mexicanus]|uniref:solute carrier organic anion transporter family member 4C1 isoform X2 n=1 Tax=Haemorhous mexicanus TaxID=30427 RepID=UPI0028BE1CC8|nr:solute carrier organic anion transporter family member 4C1 isoform X2 [Haemorhous mexicanus]